MDEHGNFYLGDGVYMSNDGFQLWLAVNDHRNKAVALEPTVFFNLIEQGIRSYMMIDPSCNMKAQVAKLLEKIEG